MSQSQPGICDLTSRQLERSRTLESRHSRNTPLPFCQMVPESRQTQMIFPRQGAHSVNSGSEDAFTLEELNVTSDFRGNAFITNWSILDPTLRPYRKGLGPFGTPMHMEPFFFFFSQIPLGQKSTWHPLELFRM
ncbi:hypothetical protein GBA52_009189 [Prunus armeniaca]|nr:hypothetical protein GBA52_009189 [Prunus armeniaca]